MESNQVEKQSIEAFGTSQGREKKRDNGLELGYGPAMANQGYKTIWEPITILLEPYTYHSLWNALNAVLHIFTKKDLRLQGWKDLWNSSNWVGDPMARPQIQTEILSTLSWV